MLSEDVDLLPSFQTMMFMVASLAFDTGNLWPWIIIAGLGAFHGINPGMGWLFALSLGLQEKKRKAVLGALPPIALGHAFSVGTILGLTMLARATLPHGTLKVLAASILFVFGLPRLVRSRHPRWVGMRVTFGDLTFWSFMMASAHGAGLMLVPLFVGSSGKALVYAGRLEPELGIEPFCSASMAPFSNLAALLISVAIHTLGHLLVAGLVALLVYEKLGLTILQKAWFNIDLVWVVALIASGLAVVFV
jgi:hypothetical protein